MSCHPYRENTEYPPAPEKIHKPIPPNRICPCGGKIVTTGGVTFCEGEACGEVYDRKPDPPFHRIDPWSKTGIAPFGYKWVGPPKDRKIIVNKAEQFTLKRAHELLSQGMTLVKVAEVLNREKRFPRKAPKWNFRNLYGVVTGRDRERYRERKAEWSKESEA